MATISVSRSKHTTLTAATVDTVTLTGGWDAIEVMNRGTDDIYFSVDGTTPTVAGDNSFVVRAAEALVVPAKTVNDVVKLISTSATAYSVTGLMP